MSVIRRTLVVIVGLLCAATLAFIVLPLAIILDPQIHSANPSWLAFGFLAAILQANDPERLAASVLFVWTAMMTVCLLPLVIAALVGEVARIRNWIWYAAGTGIIAAGMPFAIRLGLGSPVLHRQADATTQATEHRLLLLFFVTGVLSGTFYWLIAGRRAGDADASSQRSAP
jgi:hypothetical protein